MSLKQKEKLIFFYISRTFTNIRILT